MLPAYSKLTLVAILPAAVSVAVFLCDKFTAFSKANERLKQLIIGIIFGIIAIMGTDFGVPINGAIMNCRDAAVLTSGLFFGVPAGIISGVIGGVHRWFSVYIGHTGAETQIACSISTFLAGIYSAALRKYMFENKKPGALLSLAIGVVMEVFHMTMVFITNITTPTSAMEIVRKCSVVMIPANGLSVFLVAILLTVAAKEKIFGKQSKVRISQTIQRWLLLAVVLAFLLTSVFVFSFQSAVAQTQADSLLTLALDETSADISDASDASMLALSATVEKELKDGSLSKIAEKYNLSEINIVNANGEITDSTRSEFIGKNMHSFPEAKDFMLLLYSTKSYVREYGISPNDDTQYGKFAGIKTSHGFIQIGYDEAAFMQDINNQVVGITKNRHVGESGYVMILDTNLRILSAPTDLKQKNLVRAVDKVALPGPDTTFMMTINNVECRCRYKLTEGYYIFSVLPEAEAMQMRNIAIYVNTFMEILVFAILFSLIYLLIKRVVVNQIKSVNRSLAKITGGDLDEVVNVRTSEEFASLSDDINSTVDTLKKYIAEASARIDAELGFAKSIQASALPSVSSPTISMRQDFDIFASMDPAKEVGGDFYDFYITDTNTLNFLVADVSGKGIPAAMFMMRAMTELKSLTESGMNINDVFTYGNAALCSGNDAGMFVTAWQGGIDLTTGMVRFVNAGHNPPLVCHENGKFEYLKSRASFVLAGMEGFTYKMQQLQLSPGDMIYLYTDGVTEATNAFDELYGEERLLKAINSHPFASMEEMCRYIKKDVDAFVGDAPQFDDITMVALKYIGLPTMRIDRAIIQDITSFTEFIDEELEKINCPMKVVVQINIAVDELLSNIINYGYPDDPGPVTVRVISNREVGTVYIRFEDEGIPYNPLTKDDPDITLSAEKRDIGGLGIFVVKKTMDDIRYKYENGKNILTIKKLFK